MIMTRTCTIFVDNSEKKQTVDGFGVNLNTKYWNGGELCPVVDQMIDELGATLFRLDCFGKADWVDPDGTGSEADLYGEGTERAYASREFADMCECSRHLNDRGIEPYVTVSGDAPAWMCAEDGHTLVRYDLYAEMAAEYAARLRRAGIRFTLFGPFNECDLGSPEGVSLSYHEFVPACRAVLEALDRKGLTDVMLVLAEQSGYDLFFLEEIVRDPVLCGRIAVSSMHIYCDGNVGKWCEYLQKNLPNARPWVTEFGTLEQDAAMEQSYAWDCGERLFDVMRTGAGAALAWDAFDNYHDHDAMWTSFGLYQNSRGMFLPRKRFYFCKQFFRYVRPGFSAITASASDKDVKVTAFSSPDGKELTVVGMNTGNETLRGVLNREWYRGKEALGYLDYEVFLTDADHDCARVTRHAVLVQNTACKGLDFTIPPHSMFTVTNVKE